MNRALNLLVFASAINLCFGVWEATDSKTLGHGVSLATSGSSSSVDCSNASTASLLMLRVVEVKESSDPLGDNTKNLINEIRLMIEKSANCIVDGSVAAHNLTETMLLSDKALIDNVIAEISELDGDIVDSETEISKHESNLTSYKTASGEIKTRFDTQALTLSSASTTQTDDCESWQTFKTNPGATYSPAVEYTCPTLSCPVVANGDLKEYKSCFDTWTTTMEATYKTNFESKQLLYTNELESSRSTCCSSASLTKAAKESLEGIKVEATTLESNAAEPASSIKSIESANDVKRGTLKTQTIECTTMVENLKAELPKAAADEALFQEEYCQMMKIDAILEAHPQVLGDDWTCDSTMIKTLDTAPYDVLACPLVVSDLDFQQHNNTDHEHLSSIKTEVSGITTSMDSAFLQVPAPPGDDVCPPTPAPTPAPTPVPTTMAPTPAPTEAYTMLSNQPNNTSWLGFNSEIELKELRTFKQVGLTSEEGFSIDAQTCDTNDSCEAFCFNHEDMTIFLSGVNGEWTSSPKRRCPLKSEILAASDMTIFEDTNGASTCTNYGIGGAPASIKDQEVNGFWTCWKRSS